MLGFTIGWGELIVLTVLAIVMIAPIVIVIWAVGRDQRGRYRDE